MSSASNHGVSDSCHTIGKSEVLAGQKITAKRRRKPPLKFRPVADVLKAFARDHFGVIQLRQLTKRYGSNVVVDNLSVDIAPGVVTGFLGPNGAGKSTTMRLILGLEKPTSGEAMIDTQPYADLAAPLTRVGALLDAGWLHPKRSARNHLRWLAASNGISSTRVDEVLETVGLTQVAKQPAGQFSLGMRQRLGLATAMLGDPQHYILDEPVNGLDPEGIHWLRETTRRLASQGKTVLVSSHLLSEMQNSADHLIVIAQGRLLASTTVADFVAAHGNQTVKVRTREQEQFVASLERIGAKIQHCQTNGGAGLQIKEMTIDQVSELAAPFGIVELSEDQGSLEDAFIEMTSSEVEYRATTNGK